MNSFPHRKGHGAREVLDFSMFVMKFYMVENEHGKPSVCSAACDPAFNLTQTMWVQSGSNN